MVMLVYLLLPLLDACTLPGFDEYSYDSISDCLFARSKADLTFNTKHTFVCVQPFMSCERLFSERDCCDCNTHARWMLDTL